MLWVILAAACLVVFILSVRKDGRQFHNILLFLLAGAAVSGSLGYWLEGSWPFTYVLSYFFAVLFGAVCLLSVIYGAHAVSLWRRGAPWQKWKPSVVKAVLVWFVPSLLYAAIGIVPYFHGIGESLICFAAFLAFYPVAVFLLYFIYTVLVHQMPNEVDQDYILVLFETSAARSKALERRLEIAIELFCRSEGSAQVVLCGGRALTAMRDYLLTHGLDEDDIRMEEACEKGTHVQRLFAALRMIDSEKKFARIAILTEDYRVFRLCRIAREKGMQTIGVGCPVSAAEWLPSFLREYEIALPLYRKTAVILFAAWILMTIHSYRYITF